MSARVCCNLISPDQKNVRCLPSGGQFWHQLVMFFVRPEDEEEKIRGQVTGRFLET